ncbi:MarR family winged helix-turn-helix transcriptional regulator [Flammeovirga kamogawensis]|uniref:MarR family winged helix-turn-helix transcriptional regulator n=1 Tax=Flammeovirga kamogawensis TaxID=373891 RepID=A0ABX8GWE5_9BACT|nr:MarR family winged helix-turn-helix transcriptional regulator [Flammeovirga kamogawensis]MBB6461075.1 DNA-binding MarR family transcriptional regulator [Flammeovirga kamogawensis]QWG07643.1 MarR family winged helix-turn-helix transcriptional regulator [Flammeovirga kamogawensis]TRX69453.1 winged helix-turn-helix transcriptional regulator [Flammeovirga kamogawensis]
MDFYQSAGTLVLGSRLKRLGEKFLAEVSKVYATQQIDFDPSWFPIFYLLDKNKRMSLREISDTITVSHSAVSQLTTALIRKGLLEVQRDESDGRKKLMLLTEEGEKLVENSKPIWEAIQQSMLEITEETDLLNELTSLEKSLQEKTLSERVLEKI